MSIISTITNFIFPPICVHCGREGAWLCSSAQQSLHVERVITDPLFISNVDRVIVRGSYDCEPLAQLIQKLKYHYWTGVAGVLHDVVAPLATELTAARHAVIVPVPLHGRRQRERGFNQSLFISRSLGHATDLPVVNLLHRTRYTTPQAKLSAKERTTNIIGAFGHKEALQWPKSVILVDDVITTGSTIAECATVLHQHGVHKITAVAIAKG